MAKQGTRWGKTCFFCGKRARRAPGFHRHHIIPKRYGRDTPLHLVCATCHYKWHCGIDESHLEFVYYAVVMSWIDWGYGAFAAIPRPRVIGAFSCKNPLVSQTVKSHQGVYSQREVRQCREASLQVNLSGPASVWKIRDNSTPMMYHNQ